MGISVLVNRPFTVSEGEEDAVQEASVQAIALTFDLWSCRLSYPDWSIVLGAAPLP